MNAFKTMFVALTLLMVSTMALAEEKPTIVVYKSATCGCCTEWVKHLEDNGFIVKAKNVDNLNKYKEQANVPYGLGACHTGFIEGYAVEGHVPASDIKRMLTEKPNIRGLAVPGMPMGSPGMDYGNKKDAYQVIGYTKSGKTEVFTSY